VQCDDAGGAALTPRRSRGRGLRTGSIFRAPAGSRSRTWRAMDVLCSACLAPTTATKRCSSPGGRSGHDRSRRTLAIAPMSIAKGRRSTNRAAGCGSATASPRSLAHRVGGSRVWDDVTCSLSPRPADALARPGLRRHRTPASADVRRSAGSAIHLAVQDAVAAPTPRPASCASNGSATTTRRAQRRRECSPRVTQRFHRRQNRIVHPPLGHGAS